MLRIAVDARPLAHPHTGIGRYTENLLSRLVESGHQWFLYSDRVIKPRFTIDDHVQVRMGNVRPGSPLSLVYTQLVFPRWARGDCVDLFWSPRHHLPVLLAKQVRSVVTLHDLVWKRYPETMQGRNALLERALMGPSLRRAAAVITVSDFTASELNHFYPRCAGRSVTIPEAAERLAVDYESDMPLPDQPYFLFVGTPEPRKNLEGLLKAFSQFKQGDELGTRLVIVGAEGWGSFDLREALARAGLNEHVTCRGRVSDAELHQLYAGASALLLPSLYEGFGLPALEAMCHGVPVIGSNRAAIPEVVGEGGLLVDPDDVPAIATALARIVGDDMLRESLSAAALLQAGKFGWDRAARETLTVLESLGARELEHG